MDWIAQHWQQALYTLVLAAITGTLSWMGKRVKDTIRSQKSVNNGVQALLRDRIIQAYNHYMDRGECPIYALENVLALYKEYKALGGNGAIERLVNELKSLPTEKNHREV